MMNVTSFLCATPLLIKLSILQAQHILILLGGGGGGGAASCNVSGSLVHETILTYVLAVVEK